MPRTNPYKPGAGRRPPFIAGRKELESTLKRSMDGVANDGVGDQPFIVWGLRGMGKTVLLRSLADRAQAAGWIVVSFEASGDDPLGSRLAQAVSLELRRRRTASERVSGAFEHALRVFRAFQTKIDPGGNVTFSIEVEPERGFADSGNLSLDLQDLLRALGEAARNDGVGVLLAIDELQEAKKVDLNNLNVALHGIGQDVTPVPVFFLGTGLPTLPGILADATSYAERMFRYFSIEALSDQEAREALREPADEAGVTWMKTALDLAVSVAEGYPYFVQQCGSSIWEQRTKESVITEEDARAGILAAQSEIDRGLYRSRWERLSPQGRHFLLAMAEDGNISNLSAIADRLNKKPTDLSSIRRKLIEDGQIYAPSRGKLAFTVPGMDSFIRRTEAE